MTNKNNLGEFEQIVLLAILRIQDKGAYGVSIRMEIASNTERQPTPGAIYTTLDRLESKEFVTSIIGESTSERGGRAKRYYEVSAQGLSALKRTRQDIQNLTHGLTILGDASG